MKVLHQLGFEKAFILAIEPKDLAFTLVTFGEIAWLTCSCREAETISTVATQGRSASHVLFQASRDMDS